MAYIKSSLKVDTVVGGGGGEDTHLKKGRKCHSIESYSKKTRFKSVRRYYVFVKLCLKLL